MKLPAELKSPRKGLINIKSKDQKWFLWCHVRHVNALKEHPETITKKDKNVAEKLDYDGIDFLVLEDGFGKIEKRTTFALMYFVTKMGWFFQNTFQIKKLKTQWIYYSQPMVINHIRYTLKTLTDLCFTKQKRKTKNGFVEAVYSLLVIKMCWQTIKKIV